MCWICRLAKVGSIARATGAIVALSPLRKFAILHIDDDRDVLQVVREALQDEFDVVGALTLETARQRLEGDRFDLVILDFKLAGGLVEDLVAAFVGAADLPIPIVLLTMPNAISKATSGLETSPAHSSGGVATLVDAVRSMFAETAGEVHQAQETAHATQSALC
jgi:DNA-binding NtrC family response regulator